MFFEMQLQQHMLNVQQVMTKQKIVLNATIIQKNIYIKKNKKSLNGKIWLKTKQLKNTFIF